MSRSLSAIPLSSHPVRQRPRERLMELGRSSLSDAELVAVHLGSGSRGQTAIDLACRLLIDFGGVEGLGRADVDELARHCSVGPAKACRIVAAFALADRLGTSTERTQVRTSADIAAVAMPRIGRARTEQVLLVLLDGRHRVVRTVVIAAGGATDSVVPVREVLSLALRHDAVAIALAHNHPGGSVEPSDDDLAVTRCVHRGANEVGRRRSGWPGRWSAPRWPDPAAGDSCRQCTAKNARWDPRASDLFQTGRRW